MFWGTLDQRRISLLKKITANMPLQDSYLAGGTALALQIGHRKSYDFDWFTKVNFEPERLMQEIEVLGDLKDVQLSKGTFHGNLNNIRVTWLHYPNPLLNALIETDDIPNLKMASREDIALMKLIAVSSRGAKRDFVDLYFICRDGFTLRGLIDKLHLKFPNSDFNKYHIIKSLTFFDDADKDVMELENNLWQEMKRFFADNQLSLL